MRIIDPGLRVFHGCKYEHVIPICTEIKDVGAGWGDGELGKGFYTATTRAGGAAYLAGAGAVLELEVTGTAKGIATRPPPAFDWSGRLDEMQRLCAAYDYLVSSTDVPVSQFKFHYTHGTDLLTVRQIFIPGGAGWTAISREGYETLF